MQFLKYFYNKKLIISITLLLGLFVLLIEGIIDYIDPTATYSSYDLLIYVLIFPIFILFGITIANAMDESKKLNWVMRAISDVNQIIIREKNTDRLIQKTCETLTQSGVFTGAWIVLLDNSKDIVSSAESGIGEKFNEFLDEYDRDKTEWCIRKVFDQSEVVVIKNIDEVCTNCPLRPEISNINALISKLQYGDQLYGILYVSGPDEIISKPGKQLFHEVVGDLSYALSNLEMEKISEEKDQRHRTIVNDVLDSSQVGIFILDSNFHVVWINQPMEAYFGINRDEVIGKDKRWLVTEKLKHIFEDGEFFASKVLATYNDNSYTENFECHVLPDNNRQERWLEHRSQPIKTGLYSGGRIEHYYDITYRKQIENDLRESKNELYNEKDFFEKVAETSPVCITKVDKNGNIVYANSAAENVLGLSKSEIEGRTYDDVKWKITDFEGNHLLEEELPFELVQRYRKPVYDVRHAIEWPDGQRKLLSINAASISDENGNFDSMIATIEDITEMVQKRQELKESEQKFRNYVDNSPIGIFVVQSDGYYVDINPAACYMTGYTKDELLSMNITELHPEDAHEFAGQIFEELLENGKVSAELPFITKNGSLRYRILDAVKLSENRYLGFTTDITDRKMVEDELRESEERFRTVTEQAADAIIAHDFDGSIVYVNNLACEDLGYSKEELLSMNIADVSVYINSYNPKTMYWEKLTSSKSYVVETKLRRKDGSCYPAEVKLTRIELEGKSVILGFVRNITIRKQAEESLINSKLEAEAANQAKSELLANVSHELRTPLTSIIGFSDVMLKGKAGELNDNQEKYLDRIHDSGKNLLGLINDILDLSKVESGKLELHYEKISIPKFIEELKTELSSFALKKGLTLDTDINLDTNYIYADKVKLRQILYNLLYNGIKFTSKGSVTIEVKQTENSHQFSVVDTGIGIPEGKKDEIFESFKQLDSGTTRKYGGTGLGLTLVKKLVEMHGGQIWVESEPGRGSRFTFTFTRDGVQG